MIRILICDDQVVVREGIKAILSTTPDIQICGLAQDGEDLLQKLPEAEPDLVLMDLKMPFMNGIQATRILKEKYPHIHVLVLTTYDADEWVFDAIRSGADGYLLKDAPLEALVKAIRDTQAGLTPVDPSVAGKLFRKVAQSHAPEKSALLEGLDGREREILSLLGLGLSNPEIAGRLHLSEGTIRNHLTTIFSKLNVTDRTQAAVIAVRYGLSPIEPK